MQMCNKCGDLFENNLTKCPHCGSLDIKYLCEEDGSIVPEMKVASDEKEKLKEQAKKEAELEKLKYQVHCPACGSPNVEKISAASKIGHGLAFGLFSLGTISKTYHCKNCGVKF
jgi:predicted RNA-binding Zn-ribbon protein involved in translation (DUF1610 family)